jgi:hypothetical protein
MPPPHPPALARVQSVPSQLVQLAVSDCDFRGSRALAGSVLFSEADALEELNCHPIACAMDDDNYAEDYGNVSATPPMHFVVHMPATVRSGAPLDMSVTLVDGFGQTVRSWVDTVASVAADVPLSGSLRAFYGDGRAAFPDVSLRGGENTSHMLNFTLKGPDLYGHGIDTRSYTREVTVQPCAPGETFDAAALECLCAAGYGLVAGNNTCVACAANEVVPPGGLACAACPLFSTPVSREQCRCDPGYFGLIAGATGACTQCAPDTFRADDNPPGACVACPPTSHTFAPGATSSTECLCAENYFADYEAAAASGANATFTCSRVPVGGWAPQADSRLFSLEGHWRPDAAHTKFYVCTSGLCLKEEPDPSGNRSAPQRGHACRAGHGGHLCAVCAPGYSYQGTFCSQCEAGSGYAEWSAVKKGGLIFVGALLLLITLFLLFCLPLCPRVEAGLHAAVQPVVRHLDVALGTLTARPRSAARPRSSGVAGGADARRRRSSTDSQLHSLVPRAASDDEAAVPSPMPRQRAHRERTSKIVALLDLIAEPLRSACACAACCAFCPALPS